MRRAVAAMRRVLAHAPLLERFAIRVYNRWFTAEAVTRRNSPRGYERLYGSDRLFRQYLDSSRLKLYDEVAELAATYRPRRVVDVGSGAGDLLAALAPRLDAEAELVGIERSRAGIDRARRRLPSARWISGDLHDLAVGATFDVVVCMEVLEHVDDPDEALAGLLALRAPSGRLILTVPDGAVDSWEGHANFWTRTELEEWLAPHGLERLGTLDDGKLLLAVVSGGARPAALPPQ